MFSVQCSTVHCLLNMQRLTDKYVKIDIFIGENRRKSWGGEKNLKRRDMFNNVFEFRPIENKQIKVILKSLLLHLPALNDDHRYC